ncbi:MAG: hypothetical protein JNL67_00060 [Planctomycetaceae bacterium]|nr:hypothetical protein [Planctomycetaceae bacterium]
MPNCFMQMAAVVWLLAPQVPVSPAAGFDSGRPHQNSDNRTSVYAPITASLACQTLITSWLVDTAQEVATIFAVESSKAGLLVNPMTTEQQDDVDPLDYLSGKFPKEVITVKLANEIRLASKGWSYVPGPPTEPARDAVIEMPKAMFDEMPDVSADLKLTLLGGKGNFLTVLRQQSQQDFFEVVVTDVRQAEVVGQYKLPKWELSNFIVSPSKSRAISLANPFLADGKQMVFWKLQSDNLTPEKAWSIEGMEAKILLFVDENRFLTTGDHLALWDIQQEKCVYSVPNVFHSVFSRDLSHVLFNKNDAYWLMRIEDGTIVGQIQGEEQWINSLRSFDFSPDHRSLVASAGRTVYGFDLPSGQIKFSFDSGRSASRVQWADNSLLLIDDQQVWDPGLRVQVWEFQLPYMSKHVVNGANMWFPTWDRLYCIEPINEERQKQIAAVTEGLSAQDLVVVESGAQLALVADLSLLGDQAEPTQKTLQARLVQQGFVMDKEASLRLTVKVEHVEQTAEVVRDRQRFLTTGEGVERVRYNAANYEMKLTLRDEELWKSSYVDRFGGVFLQLQQGETAREAVERQCPAGPKFVLQMVVPGQISRLPAGRTIGRSQIGPNN